ncbi:calcium binding protein [Candidatus Kuenenia stuttgartiensis]|jgi:hypothetical protein|uniref:Calcium binding protein n=1 Tax=Kuenenia stuttgartiensis TaxID=174633 RepID=Q1Q2E2_KUEST|nr:MULTISPECIES: hypothetical protein [Kuenenia]MBE7548811.1 hypothetical protein [Planctomycetia bacterium]MBZ0191508.1 hypothetical protein [Candidatus Kuenenia stuttgartiensis]MCF6151750.1 hypothetical protein [Candidatus Kuenenia stuttgartiensis]MCL4727186.1 hypothetical protein [Candidatus Kuenenia stuttgartiensis]MCZ7622315.1 hypothetical protein [Candidatus Kuenenia sp.]
MTEIDKQDERIGFIFGGEIPDVTEESLATYLTYLKEHIELPCELTGIEDFDWEEYYVIGPGDQKEYEKLKKTKPSYTDKYDMLSLATEVDEWVGILVNLKRVSDKKKFTLPLAELKATDEKLKNYQLLDDYSVWFVNNR